MAIGDERCRDRPIYVRVACCGEDKQNCWYVIEDKRTEADSSSSSSLSLSSSTESASSSSTSSSSSDNDEEDGNNGILMECKSDGNNDILMECRSEGDVIRRFSIPDTELRYNSLAVLNSHLYLIGGDIDTEKIEGEDSAGFKHLEFGKSEWVLDGGKYIEEQYGVAAVGHDGLIYSVGCHQYQLSPEKGILKKLPTPPPLSRLPEKYRTNHPRLLALTETKLFIYIKGMGRNYSNLMLSYDLTIDKWDEDYGHFSGLWSAGVVLFGDYLFSFCSQNPSQAVSARRDRVQQVVVPGVYVFDMKKREWLDEPVEGLRTDGTVLPRSYMARPGVDDIGPYYSPYLLQIGQQNDRKLALLWERQYPDPESRGPRCLLIWSKFILNAVFPDPDPDPDTSDQSTSNQCKSSCFYADSLSNGLCPLDVWTDQLLNCAAGM